MVAMLEQALSNSDNYSTVAVIVVADTTVTI